MSSRDDGVKSDATKTLNIYFTLCYAFSMPREHHRSNAAMQRSERRQRGYIRMTASSAAAPIVLEAAKASSHRGMSYVSSGSERMQTAAVMIRAASAAMRIADIVLFIVVVWVRGFLVRIRGVRLVFRRGVGVLRRCRPGR